MSLPNLDALTLAVLGLAGFLLGLVELLLVLARRTPAWAKSLALAATLGMAGAAACAAGEADLLWH